MTVVRFIIIFTHVPIFLTVGFAALRYKKLGAELQVFAWFLFLSALIQGVSLILWFYKINNIPIVHLYTALGFISLAAFYAKVLRGFIQPRLIWGITIAFTCYTLFNSLFVQRIFTFNSYALTVESILLVIVTLSANMLFLEEAARARSGKLIKSLRWINSGIFIYYSSNLLVFYFGDYFIRNFLPEISTYTWVFHAFFTVVMYICFFIGLWKQMRN